ncbi:unnamed protein product [Amoebophrya sp. A25]|nr:unnamed protein product [Amoebophrya sp. A25]|eukprot:GSA25T00025182001.1
MSASSETAVSFTMVKEAFVAHYDLERRKFKGSTVSGRNAARRLLYDAIQDCSEAELAELKAKYEFEDVVKFLRCEAYQRAWYSPKKWYDYARTVFMGLAIGFAGVIPFFVIMVLSRLIAAPLQRCLCRRRPVDMGHYWRVQSFLAEAIANLFGICVEVVGQENMKPVQQNPQKYIGMFSHMSNADPFVIMHALRQNFLWTFKKELVYVPSFALITYALEMEDGLMPRWNRQQAIETCNRLAASERPPMVAPEGSRSRTGLILPELKKGIFHVQQQRKAMILPIVMIGAYELWPPGGVCRMATCKVSILPAMEVPEDEPQERTRERLRRLYIKESAKDWGDLDRISPVFLFKHVFFWLPFWGFCFYLIYYTAAIVAAFVLGGLR